MRIVDFCDNPWFDTGAFIIEFNEDEYRLLKKFAKITGRDIHDILKDALYLTLAKNIHLIITPKQVLTLTTQTTTQH